MLFEADEGSANFLGEHKILPEHFAEVRSSEDEPNVPAGHLLHDVAPFESEEYSPAGQVKQDVEPAAKEYSPSLQFEQVAVPAVGENFPAGHLREH